jgi:hypothetical protein|tara:strand:- start:219 stop:962 length:744 start_codon:yes stop_codon:yes gene_type:complete
MSVFDQQTQEETPTTPVEEIQTASVFEELVGDDKKFKSTEDLAKGKKESDVYINQLQSEIAGMRDELNKRMTSEEVLEKIRESNQEQSGQREEENTTSQLSEERLSELVKQTLESTRTEETRINNITSVDQQLMSKFGDKAGEWLHTKASELGVNVKFLQDVASSSPIAFFNTVGLSTTNQQSNSGVTRSSVNTESFEKVNTAGQAQQGTKKYFDEIRKSDPRKYWTPEVQNSLFKARMDMGQNFYK